MSVIDDIEILIKSGRLAQARSSIKSVSGKRLDRTNKFKLARMARRVGLPNVSLRLLNFFVRESRDANPLEIGEYAISLIRSGYYREGIELLSQTNTQKNHESNLYLAFAHVYQWDYEKSQIYLEKYLAGKLTAYEQLVGEVNLVSSWIANRLPHAKTVRLLDQVLEKSHREGAHRLWANALELKAKSCVLADEFQNAQKCLDQAESVLDTSASFDGLFIKKWRALAILKKNPKSQAARKEVLEVRSLAFNATHWESARDCDFYLGIWHRNRSILTHLYYGTPFEAYKKKLINESKEKFEKPESYLWRLNGSQIPKHHLDLSTGKDDLGKKLMNARRQSHKLLTALCSDFYRPARLSEIADKIFPNEYYNPNSTSDRVHKALSRLRRDLTDYELPLSIEENHGFLLRTSSSFGILIHDQSNPTDLYSVLQNNFSDRTFSMSDFENLVQWPRRTLQNWISDQVSSGKIGRIGKGWATRYSLKG